MKYWDIVKAVGSGVVREVVPGGGLIIDAVNELLPDEKKLPSTATGDELGRATTSIPPDQLAQLYGRDFDVQIAQITQSHETVRAMLDADAKSPQSTRPRIALGAFHVVAASILLTISIWAYAVISERSEMVKTIMDGWQFVLSVIGPLIYLLWAYFGILKHEHRQRMNAASGNPTGGALTSAIARLFRGSK